MELLVTFFFAELTAYIYQLVIQSILAVIYSVERIVAAFGGTFSSQIIWDIITLIIRLISVSLAF